MRSPASASPTPILDAPGDLPSDHQRPDTQLTRVGGDLPPGQQHGDTQTAPAGGDLDRGHLTVAAHCSDAPVESSSLSGHITADTQITGAREGNGQSPVDSHTSRAVADNLNGSHPPVDDHTTHAADSSEGGGHTALGTQAMHAEPSDALLLILADALDDLERTRIANENRLRALRDVKGLGGSQAEGNLAEIVATLAELEHDATLALQRAMRKHPLGPWVKRTVGIGEKQGARLIAAIGDPAWNHAESRLRRGPSELHAYCGFDPKQKRRKGVKSNWNANAKMRAYLCAESCMKQRTSPFRPVYDAERAKWAERDTTDLHKHNHAVRVVAKEILKDLWREARRLHSSRESQPTPELSPAEDVKGGAA